MAYIPEHQETLTDDEEKKLFAIVSKGKKAEQLLKNKNIPEEKRQKLEKIIDEGNDARNRIFCANLKLIDDVQYDYCYNPLYWLEDVQQDATIKLMACISSYDPKKGVRFKTYAYRCIKGCVIDTLAKNTSLLVREKNSVKQLWKINRFKSDFFKIMGRDPEDQEIMSGLHIGKSALQNVYKYNKQVYSYNSCPTKEDGATTDKDEPLSNEVFDSEGALKCDDQDMLDVTDTLVQGSLIHEQVSEQLKEILDANCTEKERMILDYRFGFYGEPMNAAEIAEKLGMDENEVELTWARVLLKLEEPCRKQGLDQLL